MALRIILDQFPEPHQSEHIQSSHCAEASRGESAPQPSNCKMDLPSPNLGYPPMSTSHDMEVIDDLHAARYQKADREEYLQSNVDPAEWKPRRRLWRASTVFPPRISSYEGILDEEWYLQRNGHLDTRRYRYTNSWNDAGIPTRARTKRKTLNGIPSRGSLNHLRGRCRPCRYVQEGEICPNGVLCNFCHFPHSKTPSKAIGSDNDGQTECSSEQKFTGDQIQCKPCRIDVDLFDETWSRF
mmetsp:Transcript_36315/g.56330  ORF Transcript_36315/g.56330 Transcript_36315/m.56330 type:complete len:241 (-) Transcript_36315:204-926(-)